MLRIDGLYHIHDVVDRKEWNAVTDLVKHGCDVNTRDRLGETPLHKGMVHTDIPTGILSLIATPDNINTCDYGGKTALHIAVANKLWHAVDFLIDKGSNKDITDINESTPLHLAVVHNDIQQRALHKLISSANLNMSEKDGFTPIHRATVRKCWNNVSLLVQQGAILNSEDNLGFTPLHRAVCYRDIPKEIFLQLFSSNSHHYCWIQKKSPLIVA